MPFWALKRAYVPIKAQDNVALESEPNQCQKIRNFKNFDKNFTNNKKNLKIKCFSQLFTPKNKKIHNTDY